MRRSPLFEASLTYAITVAIALLVFFAHYLNIGGAISLTIGFAAIMGLPGFTIWAITGVVVRKRSPLTRFISLVTVTAISAFAAVGLLLWVIGADTTRTAAEHQEATNRWVLFGATYGNQFSFRITHSSGFD